MITSDQHSLINDEQHSSRRTRNLELYSVAILSQNLSSLPEFQKKLRNIIDYITIFDTQDDVKTYIKQNEYDRIVLIVSFELAETLIKCTHDLQQLYQIYIYNPTNNLLQWTKDYKKVYDRLRIVYFIAYIFSD